LGFVGRERKARRRGETPAASFTTPDAQTTTRKENQKNNKNVQKRHQDTINFVGWKKPRPKRDGRGPKDKKNKIYLE